MTYKFRDIDLPFFHTIPLIHTTFSMILSIKKFDPNKITINEKSCKNILIYNIGYVMMKDSKWVQINSANPLYLIVGKMNGYFEETNGNI